MESLYSVRSNGSKVLVSGGEEGSLPDLGKERAE